MLKEEQTDIVLTNEDEAKFKNINLYENIFKSETEKAEKNLKENIEKMLINLKENEDVEFFCNAINKLGYSKNNQMFYIDNKLFPSMKKLKKYIHNNSVLMLPLCFFSLIPASLHTLLGNLVSIGWIFTSALFLLGISVQEYKLNNKKTFEMIKKYIDSQCDGDVYKKKIEKYVEEQPVSLEGMRLLKKIIDEETMKEILYKSKGNPIYEDFSYILRNEKNKVENKVLKKNVEEIYSNI